MTKSVAVLHWDGRLHNAHHVRAHVGLEPGASDAAVVEGAFRTWDVEGFQRLIGEWAAVLWTPADNTLYLSTDWAGSRPLFYRWEGATLRWSSELRDLHDGNGQMPPVSDEYIAAYVVSDPEPTCTPYVGIFAVPPGDVVVADNRGVRRVVGWRPTEGAIRYRRTIEYDEHFADLFREAVRVRLPSTGTASAELSGGLDSSSVVAMAADLIRTGISGCDIRTVTYVFEEGHVDDERQYAEVVRSAYGLEGVLVGEDEYPAFVHSATPPMIRPMPTAGRMRRAAEIVRNTGGSALLRGHGGDGVMWASTSAPSVSDDLGRGAWWAAHRRVTSFSRGGGATYWRALFDNTVELRRRVRGAGPPSPPWLRAPLPPRDPERQAEREDGSWAWRAATLELDHAVRVSALRTLRTIGGVNPSCPFMDRRVVQFMLSIPFDIKVRPGLPRALHRRALAGVLPPAIARRRSKIGGMGYVCRAINREWTTLDKWFTDGPRVVARGYVDGEGVRRALGLARLGVGDDYIRQLLRVISVEAWLRQREDASDG